MQYILSGKTTYQTSEDTWEAGCRPKLSTCSNAKWLPELIYSPKRLVYGTKRFNR